MGIADKVKLKREVSTATRYIKLQRESTTGHLLQTPLGELDQGGRRLLRLAYEELRSGPSARMDQGSESFTERQCQIPAFETRQHVVGVVRTLPVKATFLKMVVQ